MYWDPVTDTAWTSYQVGSQWHEAFFENPNSLYMAAQMAQDNGIAGVGIWALGMDGSNDQAMVSALDGNAPAQKDDLAGPSSTSTSPNPVELAPLKVSAPSTSTGRTAGGDDDDHGADGSPADPLYLRGKLARDDDACVAERCRPGTTSSRGP